MSDPQIDNLSYDQLVDLNRRVVERLRFLDQVRTHSQMLDFRIGEQVSFPDRDGQPVTGTLVKHNRKTVTVITPDGHRWNVSPGLLAKSPARPARPDDRIIDIDDPR